ncbi:MAG TPA: PAS domain S-box protein, partial [Devosiaceae bacterium]|nr:PAS domain S-box protein [Devosiaceae bacterium]
MRGQAKGSIAMVDAIPHRWSSGTLLLAAAATVMAAAIFAVDAFTPLGIAIAVLYSAVILLSSRLLDWRGVFLVAVGCGVLTVIAYLIGHGLDASGPPVLRFLVSLAAIATTAFLALEDKRAASALGERAGLLDLTRDGIFVRDMHDVITYWNRGAEAAYGWKAEQVVGKVTSHALTQTVFPVPLERIMAELLETGRWQGELVHTRADGSRMRVSSRWALQRDDKRRPVAILETNNDITEKVRATEALRDRETQWREVFEHNPVMYFMLDATGSVISVNGFGAGQLGFAVPELLGTSVFELFRAEDRELVRQNLSACVATPGKARSWETRQVRKDRSILWVRENAKAVERADGVIVLLAGEDITERKRNEDQVRRSQAYLAEAQRLSQVGSFIWEIKTGNAVFWSEEAYRIFGYDETFVPSPELVLQRVHPEDRAAAQRIIEKAGRDGQDYEHEYRLLMPDGAIKHIHVVGRASRNALGVVELVGVVMDVTAAKEAENRIRQIIDAVPAIIWRTDAKGEIDYHSERLLKRLGMTTEEAFKAGWGGEIHPDDYPLARRTWLTAVAERKPYECVFRSLRFDGEYRWFLSQALPLLDDAGNVLAWYGSDTDIHDRKLAEDALLKAQADLAHVTRVTTLGELSASIAHEVNQPLAAIVTNGEASLRLLNAEPPDIAEVRDALAAMISDGRRASEIIRRLRTLTKKAETQKLELNLNEIVAEVVPLVRDEVVGKHVALSVELAPDLPPVLGDKVQLQQVIINLLVNAVDAMAAVDGRRRELVVRSQRRGTGQVLVAVSDSGVGIDPQHAPKLFEAFYSTKPNGMGMGL